MVFVTVGTSSLRFDRLLEAVDSVFGGVRLVVQHGPGRPVAAAVENQPFMPFPDILENMRDADLVVCHAGAGSVLAALAAGKRPIVMPRRQSHGEAVDDHQAELAGKLAADGAITLVETTAELAATLTAPRDSWVATYDDGLVDDIARLIDERVERRRAR